MRTVMETVQWIDGEPNTWTHKLVKRQTDLVLFELVRVPSFAEPRFSDLGSSLEDRRTEVARRQLSMLRQLHALGTECAFSLRLVKDEASVGFVQSEPKVAQKWQK